MSTIMLQRWQAVTFAHWRYDSAAVARLLPAGLTVETLDGSAWVGLVAFQMEVRAPGVPAVPWLSRFPETNVRTYVHGPDGGTGIWFLSLDAARLPAVLTGRLAYGLPYFWSGMTVDGSQHRLAYRCRRRWPGPTGVSSRMTVETGGLLGTPSELDRWLTARHWLYTVVCGRLAAARADHPPWPLREASVVELADDLVAAAGLPRPAGEPVMHHAHEVATRIGSWHRLRPVTGP